MSCVLRDSRGAASRISAHMELIMHYLSWNLSRLSARTQRYIRIPFVDTHLLSVRALTSSPWRPDLLTRESLFGALAGSSAGTTSGARDGCTSTRMGCLSSLPDDSARSSFRRRKKPKHPVRVPPPCCLGAPFSRLAPCTAIVTRQWALTHYHADTRNIPQDVLIWPLSARVTGASAARDR